MIKNTLLIDALSHCRTQGESVHPYVFMYRVFLKKVLHKREEKIQEKVKMTLQEDENLVQGQQHCSVYFCTKIIFKT